MYDVYAKITKTNEEFHQNLKINPVVEKFQNFMFGEWTETDRQTDRLAHLIMK